jgi:chloramphenicol O-acetyltransferase type A
MHQDPTGGAIRIDLDNWERRELFAFFDSFSEPFHGVCLRVDCTETFRYAKDHGLSVFLTLLHRSLVAAHQVENFMMRSVHGEVWRYQTIHGSSAVGRTNGTIGFGHYPFHPDLHEFVRDAALELKRVKAGNDLTRRPDQDLIRYSMLPWFDFTSISHARDLSKKDSVPRLTFGKITEANGRYTMPVSIHVHHGLVDGEHVARFVEIFEQKLAAPESY